MLKEEGNLLKRATSVTSVDKVQEGSSLKYANPFELEVYKKKVRESELVIGNMRRKFKKMNLIEKKGFVK